MIRLFTPEEKEFVKKLLKYRDANNIQELLSSRLIRCELGILAIKYTENSISLYAPVRTSKKIDIGESFEILGRKFASCIGVSNNDADESWMYRLADILSLLQDLEDNRYIIISRQKDEEDKTATLFDREQYEELIEEDKKQPKLKVKDHDDHIELLSATFYGDVAELFHKYGTGWICPLTSLSEFAHNKFLPIEQRNSNRDNRNKWWGIAASILIAIATLLLTALRSNDIKIDETQLEKTESVFRETATEFSKQVEVTKQDPIKAVNTRNKLNNDE